MVGMVGTARLTLKTVLSFNPLLDSCILIGEFFSFSHHTFNVLGTETSFVVGNGDRLGFTRALVECRHFEDTIGYKIAKSIRLQLTGLTAQDALTVNLKSHLDLWDTTGCGGDVGKVEFTKKVVVLGHGSFSFKYLNPNSRLVVHGGREDLRFLGGHDRVSANEFGHDTTSGLDT